ncbi:hypothetical protein IAT38_006353 [Cryptococcus sp. DSM 104549]
MTMCMPESEPCPDSATRYAATANADPWYKAQHWALITAIASFIIIFVVGLINWTRRYVNWRPRKLTAILRGVGYPHVAVIDLSLGIVLALTSAFMGLFIWCFCKKPYYREGVEWGNPPLGIRAGYIAQGLVPFVFVMGSRINPLAWVTRVESGRWMIWHQYGARVLLFFSVIHTFVILYAPYRQGGLRWTTAYWEKYNKPSDFFNSMGLMVNGTVALVALVWIVHSSFAKIRNWNYEFFIIQHLLSIFLFILALWPHVKISIPDALYYAYASVGVWCFSILVRIGWDLMAWSDMRSGVGEWSVKFAGRARLEEMKGGKVLGQAGLMRLVVDVHGRWEAGQHVWLKIPSINPFQSHPFTIASPPPLSTPKLVTNPLTLLIATRAGLTNRIARRCQSNPTRSIPIILQGPFGGLGERLERFDRVLVIAGGVGAAFGWGVASQAGRNGTKVKMLWSMRTPECLEWFADDTFMDRNNLLVHITGSTDSSPSHIPSGASGKAGVESLPTSEPSSPADSPSLEGVAEKAALVPNPRRGKEAVKYGRCDLRHEVRECASVKEAGEKLAVIVCGPTSMLADVANAVASVQWDIVRGRSSLGEVWMHKERFGW